MAKANITLCFAISFLTGILLASYSQNIYELLIPIMLGVILFRLLSAASPRALALASAAFLAGCAYYHAFLFWQEKKTNIVYGEAFSGSGTVLADATRNSYGKIEYPVSLAAPTRGKAILISGRELFPIYGDIVSFSATARPPNNVYELPTITATAVTVTSRGAGSWLERTLAGLKRRFISVLNHSLPEREAALAAGLTVGERAQFSKEDKREMALSGTTHLVALSGYNIAILAEAVECAVKRRLRRRTVFFITVTVIVLFVIMVGGGPSIVRAAIMGGLVLFAGHMGRKSTAGIVIAFSAFLMGLHDPRIMRWDIGFQLSFVSLLGIVYLAPSIVNAFKWNIENSFLGWKESLAMSASAQIMVLPLSLGVFGSASLSGIAANVAIATFIPVTMFITFITGLFGMVDASLGVIAAWFARPLLGYELWIIGVFANPHATIANPFAENALFGFYYLAVAYFIVRNFRTNRQQSQRHETS